MEYYFHLSMEFPDVGIPNTDLGRRASQEQCSLSLFLNQQCLYNHLYIAESIETPEFGPPEDTQTCQSIERKPS